MKLIIDISKDRYDEIMVMDWRNCRRFFDEEIRAIHDGMPQRTGHWIYIRNSEVNGLKIVKCSECGKRTYGSGKYCQNCGAKMGSEVQE